MTAIGRGGRFPRDGEEGSHRDPVRFPGHAGEKGRAFRDRSPGKRPSPGFSFLFFSAALAWVASPGCGPADEVEDANVIVILVDTLRRDRLGPRESGETLSDCWDRIAAGGFRFTRAVAPASWTKPSVASLMTGLYPSRHGANAPFPGGERNARLDERFLTLAEALKAGGFATAAFVTNPHIIARNGFDQGFDRFVQPAGNADALLEKAGAWIEEQSRKGNRFFTYLHLIDPHLPYRPPEEYRKKYVRGDPGDRAPLARMGNPLGIELWSTQYMKWKSGRNAPAFRFDFEGAIKNLKKTKGLRGPGMEPAKIREKLYLDFQGYDDPALLARVEYLISLYEGEVAYTDDALERFLNRLDKAGVLDRSVLVMTADHGEAFLEHAKWGHGMSTHWEEVDIPLLFRVPGKDGPLIGSCDEPVSLVDIPPTVLDLLGLPPAPDMDGRSLWNTIRDPVHAAPPRRPVFSETIQAWGHETCAVCGGVKLIRRQVKGKSAVWRLYDLDQDPLETAPVEGEDAADKAGALIKAIERHIASRASLPKGKGTLSDLSEEERKQLEALGYF